MYDVDELCDRVCFMVDGRFAALDSPDALKAKFGRRVVTVDYGSGDDARSEEFELDGPGTNERSWRLFGRMKSARSIARKRPWIRFSTMSPASSLENSNDSGCHTVDRCAARLGFTPFRTRRQHQLDARLAFPLGDW